MNWSLKDRNVVEPYGGVWEDSSLSCIYCLRSGTILGSFKYGFNMEATNIRICFIVSHLLNKIWSGRRCKSTIFGASWQRFHNLWNFRTVSSKHGCNMEHFWKVHKAVIHHRYFGWVLTQGWATWDHILPALSDLLFAKLPTIDDDTLIHRFSTAVAPFTEHARHWFFMSQLKGHTGCVPVLLLNASCKKK